MSRAIPNPLRVAGVLVACVCIAAAAQSAETSVSFRHGCDPGATPGDRPIAGSATLTDHQLNIEIRDAATGNPIAARIGVFDPSGDAWAPADERGHLVQWVANKTYFYADAAVDVAVPANTYTVRAGRGFEYATVETTLVVNDDVDLVIHLGRFVDMTELGWYSGDTHCHIAHAPVVYALDASDIKLAMLGEDLNLVNVLEEEPFFTGTLDPLSDPERLIYFSKEQRNAHFSHLTILGLREWIVDQGCTQPGVACGRTLDASVYDQVHAQMGTVAVIATHPFPTFQMFDISPWPGGGVWRGMPIDLAAGKVDAMDLLIYSQAPPLEIVESYTHILNAGFHLAPSAGSDASLSNAGSFPPGGYRLYVDPQGTFSMDRWIDGVVSGRSFVSNYPLITNFEVAGKHPGDNMVSNGPTLSGFVEVVCAMPFDRVEIIGDPGVLETIIPGGGASTELSASFSIPSQGVTWVVARVTGPGNSWHLLGAPGLFAQTAPVYVKTGSNATVTLAAAQTQAQQDGLAYLTLQLNNLQIVFDQYGYFPGSSRSAFDDAVMEARGYYQSLHSPPLGAGDVAPSPSARIANAWPNPFNPGLEIEYVVDRANRITIDVYDAGGRRVKTLFSGPRDPGAYRAAWDGRDDEGVPVPSGVYFVRLESSRATAMRKVVLVR